MKRILLGGILAVVVLAGCSRQEEGIVLRVASSTYGPEILEIIDEAMAEFEQAHPGVDVQWDSSSGDDYQFAGLPSLLSSDTRPATAPLLLRRQEHL